MPKIKKPVAVRGENKHKTVVQRRKAEAHSHKAKGRRPSRRAKAPPKVELIGIDGLTNKQRVFILEYLTCWNATEAARRAGYSEKTARSIGSENLTKPDIAALIKKRLMEKAMPADEVLARLSDEASATLADFISVSKRGKVKIDLKKAQGAGKLHLLKKYSKGREGIKVELHDVQSALVLLGKHHGLFAETSKSLNIDVSKLTYAQLERIANGEDPIRVIADSSASGIREAQTPSGESSVPEHASSEP